MVHPYKVAKLRKDIEVNGQLRPIELWKGFVCDGLHRTIAMMDLGYTTIEAIDCQCPNCLRERNERI